MKTIIFRLKPGADLKQSIEEKVVEYSIKAGFIITCVGGLEQAVVRMAGAKPDTQDIRTYKGDYEIFVSRHNFDQWNTSTHVFLRP